MINDIRSGVSICIMSLLAESVSETPLQFLSEDEFHSWLRAPIQCSDADEQIINYSIEEQNYDKEKSELVCCGY